MMSSPVPKFADIQSAHERIKPYIHNTPILSSSSINDILNVDLFFKCENFQKVGAFKFRGATNAVKKLSKQEAKRGVATHSSGNHASALSLAAKQLDIPAYIVMPRTAIEIKKKAVEGYGAKITFCEPTLESREETLTQVQSETGAVFIHPYNNFDVISGQGTAAKEFLEEIPNLDVIIAPVGGGGLMSGTAIAAKAINPDIKIYGSEPANADDAFRSFKKKVLIPAGRPQTIADGLLTSLCPLTFQIIREKLDDILTVKEKTIVEAMRVVWERMKIIIEPSAAVPLASVIENRYLFKGKRIGVIISGGNVDLNNLPF